MADETNTLHQLYTELYEKVFDRRMPITFNDLVKILRDEVKVEDFKTEDLTFIYHLPDGPRFNYSDDKGNIYLLIISSPPNENQRVVVRHMA